MNPRSASKCSGLEDKPKVPLGQPMRVHEMLGLPRRVEKAVEPQLPQPVRIKDLLNSTSSCRKQEKESIAKRRTIAPASVRNISRQVHNKSANLTLHSKNMPSGESQSSLTTSARRLANAGSHEKPQPVQLGLLHINRQAMTSAKKLQPVRVKDLLASWKNSETTKPAGEETILGSQRTKKVRRKLYSVLPSPVPPQKLARKSLAPSKIQEASNKTQKSAKTEPQKSARVAATEKPSRKKSLLPPNSIRDMHIKRRSQDPSNDKKSPAGPAWDVDDHQAQLPRPTVIMTTSTIRKDRTQDTSSKSDGHSAFALSRSPLQELGKKNSLNVLKRLDAADTSFEDLLGKSDENRLKFNASDFPYNSFLRSFHNPEESLARIDRQTLAWLHANLKLCIQTHEESLFLMKRMLKAIEDVATKSSEPEVRSADRNIDENCQNDVKNISKVVVEAAKASDAEFEEKNVDELPPTFSVQPCESLKAKEEQECNEMFDDNAEDDKENQPESQREVGSGDKSRRRSARLAAIERRLLVNSDDSFSRIEAELNITHAKSKPTTPRGVTPVASRNLDTRCKRSIREYMALKSCAKFLPTPDNKGLPTPKGEMAVGTPAKIRAAERALSRQLLFQLSDLYDDSPK